MLSCLNSLQVVRGQTLRSYWVAQASYSFIPGKPCKIHSLTIVWRSKVFRFYQCWIFLKSIFLYFFPLFLLRLQPFSKQREPLLDHLPSSKINLSSSDLCSQLCYFYMLSRMPKSNIFRICCKYPEINSFIKWSCLNILPKAQYEQSKNTNKHQNKTKQKPTTKISATLLLGSPGPSALIAGENHQVQVAVSVPHTHGPVL